LQCVDATVIETSGFGIFSNKDKISLLRTLSAKRGIIILTDSDGAGFVIRNHLKGMLRGADIRQAYIPDIYGKEHRKTAPSKEGKLGVEGMKGDVIISALERAGATFEDEDTPPQPSEEPITKADMFALGYSGCAGSSQKRAQLLKALCLPERLTANGLLEVLNILYTRREFFALSGVTDPQLSQNQ
jgi:ribonuclease M5